MNNDSSDRDVVPWVSLSIGIMACFAVCVLWFVIASRLALTQIAVGAPIAFALVSIAIYAFGLRQTQDVLARYQQEGENLGSATEALRRLAETGQPEGGAGALLSEGGRREVQAMRERLAHEEALRQVFVPVLRHRLDELLAAVLRGAPLLAGDGSIADERHFPGPERRIRALMDLVLNVGIAGTFASLILTFTQSPSGSQNNIAAGDLLLSHLGPGLLSGMAAVVANIALRLCHTALVSRQDMLAQAVEATLRDDFVAELPRGLTSPDDRLAEQVATHLKTQNEHVAAQIKEQNDQIGYYLASTLQNLGDSLRENNIYMAELFALKLEPSIKLIASETEYLARSADRLAGTAAAWEASDSQLRQAHAQFLEDHKQALATNQDQLEQLIGQNQDTFVEMLKAMRVFQDQIAQEARSNFESLTNAAISTTAERTATEVTLSVKNIEKSVANTLESFNTVLGGSIAKAVSEHLATALGETVSKTNLLQLQAAALAVVVQKLGEDTREAAMQIAQHSQAADRRHASFLTQLNAQEQKLADAVLRGQQTQAEALTVWQQAAQNSLTEMESVSLLLADTVKASTSRLETAVQELASGVSATSTPMEALARRLRGIEQTVQTLDRTLEGLRATQQRVGEHFDRVNGGTDALQGALALATESLDRFQKTLVDSPISKGALMWSSGHPHDAAALSPTPVRPPLSPSPISAGADTTTTDDDSTTSHSAIPAQVESQ